ncbi:MAG: L-aspartate oxidase [Candidatus Velamenicoccus archaeovorus]
MRTVVVGAGAAGLFCALHAAERGPVALVAPAAALDAATAWAQGGIAAATGPDDSPELHAADTMAAGHGVCDPRAVRVLTREAPAAVRELVELGMPFDRGPTALEGGHRVRRVLHAGGDASGRELHRFLAGRVGADRRIERVHALVRAVTTVEGAAAGAVLEDGSTLRADRVVLATGGACGIFGHRTGPETSTGEGLILAWDAGAALADLEFVQFHPTALDVPGHPARLLTEALRGEGAVLVSARGERFMPRFHPLADLAPRDVVARAVVQVREETGGPVFLDATPVPGVAERFPVAAEQCREVGLDIAREPVPVAPAAHYFIGGVLTDTWARTTVPGLFACGEVAATGVHGANRLASNSLAEALVFGRRAAVADPGPLESRGPDRDAPADGVDPVGGLALPELRDLCDRYLGVRRTGEHLTALVAELQAAGAAGAGGARGPTLVARLTAMAALRRTESRGGHVRADFPATDPAWRLRQAVDRHGWWTVALPEPGPAR